MMNLMVSTAFGLEGVSARELRSLGYTELDVQNGCIYLSGDWEDVARLNLYLRTAGRVRVEVGRFAADTFDRLFEGVRALAWQEFLPRDAAFPVSASNVNSALMSMPDTQAITKKAIAVALGAHYGMRTLPETGAVFQVQTSIVKDIVSVTLDTSGDGLHKRGYRRYAGGAPLRETLAAALVLLSVWNEGRLLVDPFCGSGTILIEAAMIALGILPGMRRAFAYQTWPQANVQAEARLREQAEAQMRERMALGIAYPLQGYDIDPKVLRTARGNAVLAGVEDYIQFHARDFNEFSSNRKYGVVITNPPYGMRLGERQQAEALVARMGEKFAHKPDWSVYIFTALRGVEKLYGKKATRRRKLFNGSIQTGYYQFVGERPPRVERAEVTP